MSKTENFKDYPKILRIENDGRIIGLDKNGRINNEFNTNTVNRENFFKTYNAEFNTLYDKYKSENLENLSRYEKNKNSYSPEQQARPSNDSAGYYNDRDLRHELEQQQELKSSKRKNKWLFFLLAIAIIVIGIFMAKSYFNSQAETEKQASLNNDNQQLQKQIDDTKDQLSNSQQNEQQTQNKINDLQDKIRSLKQNTDNHDDSNKLQQGIDKLQEAQNSKVNGNESDMKEQLSKVDNAINAEGIKGKAQEQWYKFKTWLNNNVSF